MSLCENCSSLEFGSSNMRLIYLPKYGDMLQRFSQGCEGCRFFCDVIFFNADIPQRPALYPSAETSIHLSPVWRRAYCMTLTINDPVSEVRSESKIFLRNETSFSAGLRVNRNPKDDACFGHIQNWLRKCVRHGCRKVEGRRLPTRLIEVPSNQSAHPRLCHTDDKEIGQYLALSHCWGKTCMTRLLSKNESKWGKCIDVSLLSKNFQDALEITRRLGFKYIWIDALCILQDSVEDWARESPKMANVYNNAVLVLSAMSATNSEAGILNDRPALCSPPLGVGKTHYFLDAKYLVGEYGNGRESPLSVLTNLPLNKRGWAAQERIMAARILHYTTYEMIWECTHSCQFESNHVLDSSHALDASSSELVFNKGITVLTLEVHGLSV